MDNSKMDTLLGELANKEKIKELDLSVYQEGRDSVLADLVKIEDKINEIIEVLNKR